MIFNSRILLVFMLQMTNISDPSILYYMLKPEIIGILNINFNEILISLQLFLIAELYRYLC